MPVLSSLSLRMVAATMFSWLQLQNLWQPSGHVSGSRRSCGHIEVAYNDILPMILSQSLPQSVTGLSLLSYVATCVVSSVTAIDYLTSVFPVLHVGGEWVVCGLLLIFTLIALIGIKESSAIAFAIFVVHMSTL